MRIPPEHWLPPGQDLILTENIRRFNLTMDITLESRMQEPIMTAVTAAAGAGKTTAIYAFLARYKPQAHTGLPICTGLEVKPRSTALALARDVVRMCGYQPRGANVYDTADEAIEKLCLNGIHMWFTDEGDRLNTDSFDVLRYIHDHSRIPLVVVGLPSVLKVIDGSGKTQFSNRTSLRMPFHPLRYDEFISTILPGIMKPRWQFDPANERDLAIGQQIWEWVGTSLRETCRLIQTASSLAMRGNKASIDLEVLCDAYMLQEHTDAKNQRRKQEEENARTDQSEAGELETESARRHDAKAKGNHD